MPPNETGGRPLQREDQMTTHAIDTGEHGWGVASAVTTVFDFDYEAGRDQLLRLYDKGTHKQWIGSERIDWSTEIDPDNPTGMPDELIPIYGTPWWDRMSDAEKGELRRHLEAWRFSQFMHGEQGALMCAAKIVQTVPDLDSKFYAATQTIDEARHVEVYSRYLHDKIGLVYPLNQNLRSLLDDVISDSRWDLTYLGMQVLIEGLALAAFGLIRQQATDALRTPTIRLASGETQLTASVTPISDAGTVHQILDKFRAKYSAQSVGAYYPKQDAAVEVPIA
jgi:hypothetical protein